MGRPRFWAAVKEEVPGIANYARFSDAPKLVCKYGDKVLHETRGGIADPSIFKIFRNFRRKSLIRV
jgi:hypothetical protein